MAGYSSSTQSMQVLVTVKAYPQIGKKHGETVCVAGVRVDDDRREWVRLYPVPFRDLPTVQQFKKYQFVNIVASRPNDDRRPESWRLDPDRIELGGVLDPKAGWSRRHPYVEPVLTDSMCELQERQKADGTSLGAFRPAEILELTAQPAKGLAESKRALAAQGSLLAPEDRAPLEPPTWEFRYRYRCSTRGCNTHLQKIIDWELGEAWRKWAASSDEDRVEQIRQRWLYDIAGDDKDLVLFAGNMHQRPQNFLVLGTYYPPKYATAQQSLF